MNKLLHLFKGRLMGISCRGHQMPTLEPALHAFHRQLAVGIVNESHVSCSSSSATQDLTDKHF
jgi:hypothetical protein